MASYLTCCRCQKDKPSDDFHRSQTMARGYQSHCKACSEKRRGTRGDENRRRKCGLRSEDFEGMRWLQDDACALCRRRFDDLHPHVDHDHATGKVRGLLCVPCNVGLGFVERMSAFPVTQYLEGTP